MIVSIVGHPFAGKHALANALSTVVAMRSVTYADVRHVIDCGTTPPAARARTLVRSGSLLPVALLVELLAEAAGDSDAIVVGRPRSGSELEAFIQVFHEVPRVIHVTADESFIDTRMAALGLPPSAQEHPGALPRLESDLQPVLRVASQSDRLLTLSAYIPINEQVRAAQAFIVRQRATAG